MFSALAVAVLLLMVGFLFWMQRGLKPVLDRLHGEQVITAYLAPTLDLKQQQEVSDSIRTSLGSSPTVESKLITPADFMMGLKNQYPDLAKELEDFGAEAENMIPRYISVAGILPENAVEKVRSIPGIESAETSRDRYQHILGAFAALRWVARIVGIGVFLALMTGLIHLARMNSYLHRDAISLMKLWGASTAEMKAPVVLSALAVGFIGGMVALIGWFTGGVWLISHIKALSPALKTMPLMSARFGLLYVFLGSFLGLGAGFLGSFSIGRPAAERK